MLKLFVSQRVIFNIVMHGFFFAGDSLRVGVNKCLLYNDDYA